MSQTQQTPPKTITITTSISNKTNDKHNRKIPIFISISSSTFMFSFVSLSLLSFSLFFLSFKDTTFWFFLSNAIIFFIAAAHSDTFSPSKPKPDLYDEYLKNIRSRSTYRQDDIKENVTSPKAETVTKKLPETETVHPVTENPVREKYSRSETEKGIVVMGGKKKIIRRSQTENAGRKSDDGDLSAMSDEELNRRVDEFIKRINREIRLPEIRDQNEI